jgi:phage tail-like protein
MAGDKQDSVWPLPKYYFKVEVDGGLKASFQEVSGLDADVDVAEYRHGDSPVFSKIKMPGIKKYSDITLKKGHFTKDVRFFEWFNENKLNTIARKTVTIMLLNESGSAEITWTLTNAFPKSVKGTELNSGSSDAAIETLVLAHEGLTVKSS